MQNLIMKDVYQLTAACFSKCMQNLIMKDVYQLMAACFSKCIQNVMEDLFIYLYVVEQYVHEVYVT